MAPSASCREQIRSGELREAGKVSVSWNVYFQRAIWRDLEYSLGPELSLGKSWLGNCLPVTQMMGHVCHALISDEGTEKQ